MKQQEGNLKGKSNSASSLRVRCIERSHEQITPTSGKHVSALSLPVQLRSPDISEMPLETHPGLLSTVTLCLCSSLSPWVPKPCARPLSWPATSILPCRDHR